MTYNDKQINGLLQAVADIAEVEEALAMIDKTPDALAQDIALQHQEVDDKPLPPVYRKGLQALLSGIRRQEDTQVAEVSAVVGTVGDEREPALAAPDGALDGVTPYQEFTIAPYWVQLEGQGSVELPVAAVEVKEAHTFDFRDTGYPGAVSCELHLETEYQGEGLLRFRWAADHVPTEGWWVAVYKHKENAPCFEELLGHEAKGEVVFPAALLGFDPSTTPFRYLLYPR